MLTSLVGSDDQTHGGIRHALAAVRKHLGMEVAYISEFVGERTVFREVDAPGLEALIKTGDSQSLDDVYCRHILAGRLPELMADTAAFPLAHAMPITRAVPIGAHMSVPIRLADGSAYGMFCCLSPHPNPSLNDRDLQVMRVFADLAGHQIDRDQVAERVTGGTCAAIQRVIADDLFTIAYQPIFGLAPRHVLGFEALCRFSPLPYRTPDLWFNEAAAAGCGVRLEIAVLKRIVERINAFPEHVFISINASPETIVDPALAALLRGAPPGRLVLEVTEHAVVQDYAGLLAALGPIRGAGVKLAIDDAGAGYASLQHIVQLRPDIIKLDMGLIRCVDTDSGRRAMVAAFAYFASETGCQVVAEGIETETEFAALRSLGINKGQGYLLGRPADLRTAQGLVEARPVAARSSAVVLG